MKGGENILKKIDIKAFAGIGMAAIMGIATFIGTMEDRKKEKQIDELIDKVEKLTEEKE